MTVNFDKKTVIIIVISLLVGVLLGNCLSGIGRGWHFKYSRGGMESGKMYMMKGERGSMNMRDSSGMSHMMMGMTANLEGKTGDEFDKAFLSDMIIHHEGAVKMAELAKKNSTRTEITSLADAIIGAQNKEITDMKGWLKSWFNIDSNSANQ